MSSVSVVIPAYNRAHLLPATVASVLQQTVEPLEILIVDDGSSDDTPTLCSTFPPPVRYIRQENAGLSAARNRGIREARGNWLAFIDSDDLWHRTKLAVQLAVFDAHPAVAWSTTECEVIDNDGRQVSAPEGFERVFPVFGLERLSPNEFFSTFLAHSSVDACGSTHTVYWGDAFTALFRGNFILPSATMIRRDVVERVGLFDESFRFAEETEFFHRLAARFPVAVIMTPLTQWRTDQSNSLSSGANTERLIEGALTSLDRAARLRGHLSPIDARVYAQARQRLLLSLAYAHLARLDRRRARRTVTEGWRHGAPVSPRSAAIFGASLLPRWGLRALHAMKRRFRR
jgi:glycosyltransferase involved in cell wall biosynthesis